jgi:hypothetical protein
MMSEKCTHRDDMWPGGCKSVGISNFVSKFVAKDYKKRCSYKMFFTKKFLSYVSK